MTYSHNPMKPRDETLLPSRYGLEKVILPPTLFAVAVRFVNLWGVPQLLDDITFCSNPRLRRTVARYVLVKHQIELGPLFSGLHQLQAQIICHELAHAAAVAQHGRTAKPHGREWRQLVQAAGFDPQTHLTIMPRGQPNTPRNPSTARYEHRCSVCQSVRFSKLSANRWLCCECKAIGLKGSLTVSRVKQKVVPA